MEETGANALADITDPEEMKEAYMEWVMTKIPKSISQKSQPLHPVEQKEKDKRDQDPIYKAIQE